MAKSDQDLSEYLGYIRYFDITFKKEYLSTE